MPTINQLPLITQLSGGDNLVVWASNQGDSRRVSLTNFQAWLNTSISISASQVNFIQNGAGAVTRTAQSKMRDIKTPMDFGAVGDGLNNDTGAMQAALNSGGTIDLAGGRYLFNHLTIDTPVSLTGSGVLVYDGLATPAGVDPLVVNAAFEADELVIEAVNGASASSGLIAAYADNIDIGVLDISCSVQRTQTGGCNFYGNDIYIGEVRSKNIARPVAFVPVGAATTVRTNIHIGPVFVENYIRAVKFAYATNFSLAYMEAKTRWTGQTLRQPGHNGILLSDVSDFTIGDMLIESSLEHGVRIGGLGVVENFSFGVVTTKDSGGCALKFNPDPSGVVRNGSVAGVVGINCGEGTGLGNTETVRLTRIDGLHIGYIAGYEYCKSVLTLADIQNLTVGEIYGENVAGRLVTFDDTQDTSSLNCTGVHIGSAVGYMQGVARAAIGANYSAGGRTLSDIYIYNLTASGYSDFLVSIPTANFSGEFFVNAVIPTTAIAPLYEGAPASDNVICTIAYGRSQYTGRADSISFQALNTLVDGVFDPTLTTITQPAERGQRFAQSSATPAIGAYGGSYVFSRIGSGRRGAAIAAKQITADNKEVSLSFLVGDTSTTANESLLEKMLLKYTGTLYLASLSAYANNADALAGGLVVGDVYKTATGEVRIVV